MIDLGKIGQTPKGIYNNSIIYDYLDVVSDNGNSYVSRIPNNNQPLTNINAWQINANKGNDGIDGTNAQSFNFKNNVENYESLPSTGNSENDAYYNLEDDKLYVYNGSGFPEEGSGIKLKGEDGANGTAEIPDYNPALSYVEKSTVIDDNSIWRVADGQTANVGEMPGISNKWKSITKIPLNVFSAENNIDASTMNATANYLIDLDLAQKTTETISQIKPEPFTKFTAASTLDRRSYYGWFKGVSTKKINRVKIPITSVYNGSVALTDSVFVKIGINNTFVFSTEITLSQMDAQNIDTQSGLEAETMYEIQVPDFTINNNDILFVGVSCKSETDKLGFVATNTLENEWINGYNYYDNNSVTDLTVPIAPPSTNGAWAYNIYFSLYTEVIIPKSNTSQNSYFDKVLNRNIIGEFLQRLRKKENLTAVFSGDSITQFLNSGTFNDVLQRISPIGLSASSWVQKVAQLFKYYEEDTQYRRFDHADFYFSNGIQNTASAIGSNGWATNRNDGEGWRQNNVYTSFPQSITSVSSYSKPIVGTNKINESLSINIPSTATYVEIVFIEPPFNSNIEIKINNGLTDIVSQNEALNTTNYQPIEFVKRFEFASGTLKTLTVKNTGGGTLWVWGIVYGSTNKVRSINSGMGGNNVTQIGSDYNHDRTVKLYNPDLVFYECNILNDCYLTATLVEHSNYVRNMMDKLKNLNIPIIIVLTHRGINSYKLDRGANSSAVQNSVEFLPELLKNYRAEAHKNGFAIIDIWSKSFDLLGITEAGNGNDLFLDNAHLNQNGNQMYFEEFEKLFLTQDFE